MRLLLGILLGLVGVCYWYIGKGRNNTRMMMCGAALCVFPYFVENVIATVLIGAAACAVPFVFPEE